MEDDDGTAQGYEYVGEIEAALVAEKRRADLAERDRAASEERLAKDSIEIATLRHALEEMRRQLSGASAVVSRDYEDLIRLRAALRDMIMHYERAMDRYPIMDEPAAWTLDHARALLSGSRG